LVVGLVRTEVERAVGRVGFVREEELAAVRAHVDRLEDQLKDTIEKVATASATAAGEAKAGMESAKTLAESTAMRKMGLEYSAPEETDIPPKKTIVRTPAESAEPDAGREAAPAKKAAAKKTAKKAPAKKAPAKKAAAKKTTTPKKPAASKESAPEEAESAPGDES
jgi:ribonuclease E